MLLPICDRINSQKVCTRWTEVCKLAWYDIKKYECSHSIGRAYNDQFLTQSYVENLILNCGIYLQELILSKICTSSIMPIVGKHCKNLTRLEFVFDEEFPVNEDHYIQAFKKLKRIKFIKIHIINQEFDQKTNLKSEILCSLPEEINEIHVIFKNNYLCHTPWFFDLKKFKNLQGLTLSGCSLNSIMGQLLKKITLVYLNLERSSMYSELLPIIASYFNKLVNLENIHLFENFGGVSPNFVRDIFNTCQNLRYFNVSESYFSGSVFMTSIEKWENHNHLEYLTVVWFPDHDSALKIVKYCNNLKYLSFKTEVKETVLQKLTELKNLECLEFFVSHNLSDESVLAITNNCKKLKHLEISYKHRIYRSDTEYEDDYVDVVVDGDDDDDEPVLPLTVFDELSKLEYLESLNVSGVHEFTDSSIIAVANKCKSLKCLNISHCIHIAKTGLNAIVSLESLQKLNVSNLESVTNSFIIKLKGLKSFEATRCKKITDSGVIQFIKNCPDLEQLHLFATSITINTIMAADRETEYRKNGITLHLVSCRQVLEIYNEQTIRSKWFVIYYHK